MADRERLPNPARLIAELTHACPLGCPYCSNPLVLVGQQDELDSSAWADVFRQAAALGIREVHLSGGEPAMRRDLVEIVAHARETGLATHLVTSGFGIAARTMRDLWEAGLQHVRVSFQDADAVSSDRIGGRRGAFQRQCALAVGAVRLGLPLTVDFVVHRANIGRVSDMVGRALAFKAERVTIGRVRYRGWALKNRAALMPTVEQVRGAVLAVEEARRRYQGRIAIGAALDDHRAGWPDAHPKLDHAASMVVTPSGDVAPGGPPERPPGLEPWNVRDHPLAEIWFHSPAFTAIRADAPTAAEYRRLCLPDEAAAADDVAYVYRR